jgi:hypothetical protein
MTPVGLAAKPDSQVIALVRLAAGHGGIMVSLRLELVPGPGVPRVRHVLVMPKVMR